MKFRFLRALTLVAASLTILSSVCLNADAQDGITPNWFGQAYSRSQPGIQSLYNSNAQQPLGGLFAPGFTRTLTILGGVNFPSAGTEDLFDSQIDVTPEDPTIPFFSSEGSLEDTGYALSFAFGRRHSNNLRSEIEVAIRGNDITDVNTTGTDITEENDGRVIATSLMKNFIVDFSNQSRFTPYAGFGLGLSFIDVEQGTTGVDGEPTIQDDEVAFSYQAIGGVATQLNPVADFIVEYRFLGTSEVEIDGFPELTYNTSSLFFGFKFEY